MEVPDDNLRIQFDDGMDLTIYGMVDSLNYYEPLDAHWLRYCDPETSVMVPKPIKEAHARFILEMTNIPYAPRDTIYPQERKAVVDKLGEWLVDSMLDFEPEEIWQPDEGELDEEVEE